MADKRETFTSNFGLLMTMIGVAVGLGNVWRFPYMVGKFGGAAFVFIYLLAVLFIGIPALMCEWTLGRYTQRGTLGAFQKGGLPGGKYVGGFFFCIVIFATGYYSVAMGWLGYHAAGELLKAFNVDLNPSVILPPANGFDKNSLFLQLLTTAIVIFGCSMVLLKGLKKGIEKTSKFIIPTLLIILIVLIILAVFFYWKFKVLNRRQMTFARTSALFLFIIVGAWTVLLEVPNATSYVILAPLFYFIWFYLTKLTANLIHRDDHKVIHFV